MLLEAEKSGVLNIGLEGQMLVGAFSTLCVAHFTGSVAGGLILVQVTEYIAANTGWQQAYLVLGIIAAVVSIPVTLFIVRGTPQEKGLLPMGATCSQEPRGW